MPITLKHVSSLWVSSRVEQLHNPPDIYNSIPSRFPFPIQSFNPHLFNPFVQTTLLIHNTLLSTPYKFLMPITHNQLIQHYILRLRTQLSQLQTLASQSTMHTSFLSAAVVSLLAISVSAAPMTSPPQSTVQAAHLPGSPHGPVLHPSGTSASGVSSEPSAQDLETRHASRLNVDVMKNLIVEIKRDDMMSGSQDQSAGNGQQQQEDDGENHATYMLGSPVSFPARGGQGGRNVA
jgi:hypothetical protein